MSVSLGTVLSLFNLVRDFTQNIHSAELEQGNSFLINAQHDNNLVNFDQAISCFVRINDDDKKYARCMAYYALIACYVAKCKILVRQCKYSAAKQELHKCIPYIGMIERIKTTILTLNPSTVKEIKSLVPQFRAEYDMLESMIDPIELFFDSNSKLTPDDLTSGNNFLRQALQFDDNCIVNLDNAIQHFENQYCNAYYGIALSCALKYRKLMINGDSANAKKSLNDGQPYINMIANIDPSTLPISSEYIEYVTTLLPNIRNDYRYLANYR